MIQGKSDFSTGLTTRERVRNISADVMNKLTGYDGRSGALIPDALSAIITTATNFTGKSTSFQTPVIVKDADTRDFAMVIATSSDNGSELFKTASDTVDATGTTYDEGDLLIEDSTSPVRYNAQVLFATRAGIKAYEAGSTTTKIRPLSLKSPLEYDANLKPIVQTQTYPGVQLFNSSASLFWSLATTALATIVETASKVEATVRSTDTFLSAGDILMSTNLATTYGTYVDMDSKSWLLVDYAMTSQELQDFSVYNLFPNDPLMKPSGYALKILDDANAEITTIRLPKPPEKKISRIVVNTGSFSQNAKTIQVITDTMWTTPTYDVDITLYSEDYSTDWKYSGNYLLPSVLWEKSPYAEGLINTSSLSTGLESNTELLAAVSIDADFSGGSTGWRTTQPSSAIAGWKSSGGRTDNSGCYVLVSGLSTAAPRKLYTDNAVYPITGLQAGYYHTLSFWARKANDYSAIKFLVELEFSTTTGVEKFRYFPSNLNFETTKIGSYTAIAAAGLEWASLPPVGEWKNYVYSFLVPADATDVIIRIVAPADVLALGSIPTYRKFVLDDFDLRKDNYVKSDTTVTLMDKDASGENPNPDYHGVIYNYALEGKSLLGSPDFDAMISNPINDSVTIVADPWIAPRLSVSNASVVSSDYGDYLDRVLWFRRFYNGESNTYENWECVKEDSFDDTSNTLSETKTGLEALTYVMDTIPAPTDLPQTNDSAPIARHLAISDKRLYMGCLNWDDLGQVQTLEASAATITEGTFKFQVLNPSGTTVESTDLAYNSSTTYGVSTYSQLKDAVEALLVLADYPDTRDNTDLTVELSDTLEDATTLDLTPNAEIPITISYAGTNIVPLMTINTASLVGGTLSVVQSRDQSEKWQSPTAIQVSSFNKIWACPAGLADPLPTDGEYLDGFAETGSEIRGIVVQGDNKIIFLDNEFFLLRGDTSFNWQIRRIDAIGCVSGKTAINCRGLVIWSDGTDFYAYNGGIAQTISRFQIDASLIDFTKAHNAAFWNDRYYLFCEYDSVNCLLIYDIPGNFWRITYSDVLADHIVGITADYDSVFGLTSTGEILDLFGTTNANEWSPTGHAVHANTKEVTTQYIAIGEPGFDVAIRKLVFEITGHTATQVMNYTADWQGAKTGQIASTPFTIYPDTTRYTPGCNITCNAIKLGLTWTYATGYDAPNINFMGVDIDETPVNT